MLSPFLPFGKPPFGHTLALLEKFADRPERRGAPYRKQCGPQQVTDRQRSGDSRQSHDKKNPPASNAEIVFPLDDQRVKKSDNQKRRHADDDTRQVIMSQKFHILGFWDKDTENRMTRNGPAAFPLCGVAFDMACYCAARKKDAILMPRLCPIFVAE